MDISQPYLVASGAHTWEETQRHSCSPALEPCGPGLDDGAPPLQPLLISPTLLSALLSPFHPRHTDSPVPSVMPTYTRLKRPARPSGRHLRVEAVRTYTDPPHRPPPTDTGPLWTPTQFAPRWVGAFSSAQGRPGEPTSLSLLLWVLALRAPHSAPPGLVCPWPESPTLSREAPLNLSQLCLGMSWRHLGS